MQLTESLGTSSKVAMNIAITKMSEDAGPNDSLAYA